MSEVNKPRVKPLKNSYVGIPENVACLKCTEVVPVKLPSEVKDAIPEPKSTWIREAIIEKLRKSYRLK